MQIMNGHHGGGVATLSVHGGVNSNGSGLGASSLMGHALGSNGLAESLVSTSNSTSHPQW